MRFFAFSRVVARRCVCPTKVKDIDIPYDLTIVVDVLSVHFDQDIWGPVDVDKFYPQRLSILISLHLVILVR